MAERPSEVRPAIALPGLKRIVNQLYTNDGALVVEQVEGSSIALADVDTGAAISLAALVRTLELMLQEMRTTNLLLANLKEPGGISDPVLTRLGMTQ